MASRTSAFAYQDSELDATAIATNLNVGHILEGSVRRSSDRIRVTAQLVRASDGAHLWSDNFDVNSKDSIVVQEQIAFEMASLLDTAMDPEELRRMVSAGTRSITAWESFVQLRELGFRAAADYDDTVSAEQLRLYEQVVQEDPEFAEAHLLFAEVVFGWMNPSIVMDGPAGLSSDDLQKLFAETSTNAMRYARNEDARLGAEILRARVQLRFGDLAEFTRARLQFHPYDRKNFDPAPYPNLTKRLEEQDIMRYDVIPLYFACRR